MLELKDIKKGYKIGDNFQQVLKGITINFRKCEFVSILGSSGSGKTTLLNIIGGLDKYDDGDLIIEGVSTKKYTDRNWDSYRNYRVGFIFQNYNLIMHQTVLSNVEIALTLSGISKTERKKRATEALNKVGLSDQINKKPSQLSGGQMQRVAIARALVNNPEIILADEPTGALDSVTSIQIMDLLREIAKDKLVIMVTHNPDIAKDYSNRIINIKDGLIVGDTNPYQEQPSTNNDKVIKRTSMSLLTSLILSFNNLLTKKGRTILTAIAGSIGIIGIALILALSNGVKNYASSLEKDSLSNYPLTITREDEGGLGISFSELFEEETKCEEGKLCSYDNVFYTESSTYKKTSLKNNLKEFKKYLDSNKDLDKYIDEIYYDYYFVPHIYTKEYEKVNPHDLSDSNDKSNFMLISSDKNNLDHDYKVLAGHLPENYNEIVLIVPETGLVSDSILYALNILKADELEKQQTKINMDENYRVESKKYAYDDFLNHEYKLILNTDYYKEENGAFIDYSNNREYMNEKIDNGVDLKIVGVLTRKNKQNLFGSARLGYTDELMDYVIGEISKTDLYTKQMENKEVNILNGQKFDSFNNTYDDLVLKLALYDKEDPFEIDIFPKDYNSKDKLLKVIDEYNEEKKKNNQEDLVIRYTDALKSLISGFSSVVSIVSVVLIGIAAISLIVSSIMIAIITYISVLERTKEIGILRSIGASKKDITNVFRAETMIEGFLAGAIGIIVALLFTGLANAILKASYKVSNLASLSIGSIIFLILLSVVLNVLAGLIPSQIAARKNPVEALRSE